MGKRKPNATRRVESPSNVQLTAAETALRRASRVPSLAFGDAALTVPRLVDMLRGDADSAIRARQGVAGGCRSWFLSQDLLSRGLDESDLDCPAELLNHLDSISPLEQAVASLWCEVLASDSQMNSRADSVLRIELCMYRVLALIYEPFVNDQVRSLAVGLVSSVAKSETAKEMAELFDDKTKEEWIASALSHQTKSPMLSIRALAALVQAEQKNKDPQPAVETIRLAFTGRVKATRGRYSPQVKDRWKTLADTLRANNRALSDSAIASRIAADTGLLPGASKTILNTIRRRSAP